MPASRRCWATLSHSALPHQHRHSHLHSSQSSSTAGCFVMSPSSAGEQCCDEQLSWTSLLSCSSYHTHTHTHTHTHLMAFFPGQPRWASTRKVEPIWILLKQETVSGSGISWARCKSALAPDNSHANHAITPPPSFLQARCPSCRPTNSVKALKALQ